MDVAAETLIIAVAAVLTSILSAVAGLGGGVILLTILAQFFTPIVAIPIQGGIQLASNASRAVLLRRDLDWSVVGPATVLLLPGSFLGVLVATSLPEDVMRIVLGVFVLIVAWRPALLRWRGETRSTKPMLVSLGGASGFLNTTVGASGPFTSPFLKAVTATHVAFVATAACTQVAGHTAKLIAFGLDGFDFREHIDVIAVGAAGVVAGSWIGTRLLGRVPERGLDRIFRLVLTALALRLLIRAVW